MKIGMYSVTYRGVWYKGSAIDVVSLLRLAKQQGWEGIELDTERPHAAPMDLSADDRKRVRDVAGELGLPICAVSPNCDLSSPVPVQREAMICYVRECIKLARDLGAPLCKVFAAWRGITLHDGLATYDETYGYNQYGFWTGDRREFVVEGLRELASFAEDHGVVLAMQNHGPDVVNTYTDVLALIRDVGSPALKGCIDINIEPEADSPAHAREMARACGTEIVHSHFNAEFVVEGLRELASFAEDHGVVLAMQNHGPDVVNTYTDVLALIRDVGSPALKGCIDINIEPDADSPAHAREMARACGTEIVHSHFNAEFDRAADGDVELVAGGYFDDRFWQRRVAYPAYVDALVEQGYEGYMNWEFCHPAMKDGAPAGIEYVKRQTELALEYMRGLRAQAEARIARTAAPVAAATS